MVSTFLFPSWRLTFTTSFTFHFSHSSILFASLWFFFYASAKNMGLKSFVIIVYLQWIQTITIYIYFWYFMYGFGHNQPTVLETRVSKFRRWKLKHSTIFFIETSLFNSIKSGTLKFNKIMFIQYQIWLKFR